MGPSSQNVSMLNPPTLWKDFWLECGMSDPAPTLLPKPLGSEASLLCPFSVLPGELPVVWELASGTLPSLWSPVS